MYYATIGALALLILVIENQDILFRRGRSFETPAWRIYRRFLYAVLAYYFMDILWGLFESRKLPRLLFADTTGYFIAVAVGVLFWAEYTVACLEELLGRVADHNKRAQAGGGIIIACGVAKYAGDAGVAPIFERADRAMYENKILLKSADSRRPGDKLLS